EAVLGHAAFDLDAVLRRIGALCDVVAFAADQVRQLLAVGARQFQAAMLDFAELATKTGVAAHRGDACDKPPEVVVPGFLVLRGQRRIPHAAAPLSLCTMIVP